MIKEEKLEKTCEKKFEDDYCLVLRLLFFIMQTARETIPKRSSEHKGDKNKEVENFERYFIDKVFGKMLPMNDNTNVIKLWNWFLDRCYDMPQSAYDYEKLDHLFREFTKEKDRQSSWRKFFKREPSKEKCWGDLTNEEKTLYTQNFQNCLIKAKALQMIVFQYCFLFNREGCTSYSRPFLPIDNDFFDNAFLCPTAQSKIGFIDAHSLWKICIKYVLLDIDPFLLCKELCGYYMKNMHHAEHSPYFRSCQEFKVSQINQLTDEIQSIKDSGLLNEPVNKLPMIIIENIPKIYEEKIKTDLEQEQNSAQNLANSKADVLSKIERELRTELQ